MNRRPSRRDFIHLDDANRHNWVFQWWQERAGQACLGGAHVLVDQLVHAVGRSGIAAKDRDAAAAVYARPEAPLHQRAQPAPPLREQRRPLLLQQVGRPRMLVHPRGVTQLCCQAGADALHRRMLLNTLLGARRAGGAHVVQCHLECPDHCLRNCGRRSAGRLAFGPLLLLFALVGAASCLPGRIGLQPSCSAADGCAPHIQGL